MTLFLNIILAFFTLITGVSANIQINDRFNYCKYDLTSPILDINYETCFQNNYFLQNHSIETFKLLEQYENQVYGEAFICEKQIKIYKAHTSFWGRRELTPLDDSYYFSLSPDQCWQMITNNYCDQEINKSRYFKT